MDTSYEKYVGVVFDGRYKIEKVIGLGGMAVVFRALDITTDRVVALKLLREDMAQEEESVKRFINESKAVAMLSHPNIVKIYAVSVKEDHKYIVMEYVEGITLKAYMQKKKILTSGEILGLSKQILKALDHAHQKGIVHRDIKPQNIMLLKNGQIKVTDFGIAKLPNAETVTMTDKAIGTVFYISPEQASGQPIDSRSDLYSLGITMYEMATGELPFNAESPVSVALMQVSEKAVDPREINPAIPKGLEQIILHAMEKKSDERYQSAAEMLTDVLEFHKNPETVFKYSSKKTEEGGFKGIVKQLFNGGSMLPVVLGVTIPFIIIFIVCIIILFGKIVNSEDTSEPITVPKFVGSYYTEDLQLWFEESDIYTVEIKYDLDSEYEEGYIISQTPKEGSKKKVRPGIDKCEIVLTVSGEAGDIIVPNIYALEFRDAEIKLKSKGIVYTVEQIFDEVHEPGQVIKTEPASGETLASGEKLVVYVSLGADTGAVTVPKLVGKSRIEAITEIINKGLIFDGYEIVKSDKPVDQVVKQDPPEGSDVAKNHKVFIEVSGGPDYDPNAESTTEPETTEKETKPVTKPKPPKPAVTTEKETKPVTEPAETTAAQTEPAATEPPVTEPAVTETTGGEKEQDNEG